MPSPVAVGILGGSGPAGRGLGARLAAGGIEVVLGFRDRDRAESAAASVLAGSPGRRLPVVGGTNEDAAGQPLVVLATPWDGAVATVRRIESLLGKVVVSMVHAITRVGGEFQALVPVRGSMAATVQAALTKSSVSAAFHHLSAGAIDDLDECLDADVLVCADDPAAAEPTVELIESIDGLRGVIAGLLASANAVEAITAVLLNVNVRYKAHVAIRLAGLGGLAGAG